MSHLRKCSLSLKNVDNTLVEEVINAIAKEVNGTVVNEVRDYFGNSIKVIAGVTASNIRGFGIVVEKNEVKVVGDDFGQDFKIDDFKRMFTTYYTTLAINRSLNMLGYTVNTHAEKEKIYIYGVRV
ncbi:MAG: hypothetical protein QXQ33_00775 [Nitrososphaerota archaeon]